MRAKPRLLAITDKDPFGQADGETYAVRGQLTQLAADWEVELLYVRRRGAPGLCRSEFRDYTVEAPRTSRVRRLLRELSLREPYFMVPVSAQRLRSVLKGDYQVVYGGMMRLAGWVRAVAGLSRRRPCLVLNINDAMTERFRYHAGMAALDLDRVTRLINGLQGLRRLYFGTVERKTLASVDMVLVQTAVDREALCRDCGSEVERKTVVVTSGCKTSMLRFDYTGANTQRLLYLATMGSDQCALLRWFLKKVFFGLRRKHPRLTIDVVGAMSPNRAAEFANVDGVRIRGWVDDMDEVFKGITMLVAPAFMRGGLLTRVMDAMAAGVPCSGIGAFNGFGGFQNGTHGLSAETADEWQTGLSELLSNSDRLVAMSSAGRELAHMHSWDHTALALREQLQQAYEIGGAKVDG